MAYMQTISFGAADRITVDREEARLPYLVAVPIWISLAVAAWSPIIVLFHGILA